MTNSFEGRIFVNSSVSDIANYVANLFPNFGPEQVDATVVQYNDVAGLSSPLDQAIAITGECE